MWAGATRSVVNCRAPHKWRTLLITNFAVLLLNACAGLEGPQLADYDEADFWDSSLIFVRHIDVSLLASAHDRSPLNLSGFVSAIAANGDNLFFVDQGSGRLVQLSLSTMTADILATLRIADSNGLYASNNGRVYVLDQFERTVVAVDTLYKETHRYSLASVMYSPSDIAMVDDEQFLVVIDGLDGRMAKMDKLGGVYQLQRTDSPSSASLMSVKAIAAGGNNIFVLDDTAGEVIGFDRKGQPVGLYATDELGHATALTADSCGRFFVADDNDGSLFVGLSDMSLPGVRVPVEELTGTQISDLWTDDVFLYVATRVDGIYVFLIDPECGL